jgi:hypothetical protein
MVSECSGEILKCKVGNVQISKVDIGWEKFVPLILQIGQHWLQVLNATEIYINDSLANEETKALLCLPSLHLWKIGWTVATYPINIYHHVARTCICCTQEAPSIRTLGRCWSGYILLRGIKCINSNGRKISIFWYTRQDVAKWCRNNGRGDIGSGWRGDIRWSRMLASATWRGMDWRHLVLDGFWNSEPT